MSKLLLLSLVVATVALPLRMGKVQRPGRALRSTIVLLIAFNAFYLLAVRYLYTQLPQ